jgi:multidrug efflux system membrane fusion protein
MQYRLTDSDKALVDANPAAPTLNKDGTNTALAAAAAANKNKRSQD